MSRCNECHSFTRSVCGCSPTMAYLRRWIQSTRETTTSRYLGHTKTECSILLCLKYKSSSHFNTLKQKALMRRERRQSTTSRREKSRETLPLLEVFIRLTGLLLDKNTDLALSSAVLRQKTVRTVKPVKQDVNDCLDLTALYARRSSPKILQWCRCHVTSSTSSTAPASETGSSGRASVHCVSRCIKCRRKNCRTGKNCGCN